MSTATHDVSWTDAWSGDLGVAIDAAMGLPNAGGTEGFTGLGEAALGFEKEKPNFENPNFTLEGFIVATLGETTVVETGAWFSLDAGCCWRD